MKKLTLIAVMMISFIITLNAQNSDYIDVKKGKNIKGIKIQELHSTYLVYEENGSLHDILVSNINYIIKDENRQYLNIEGDFDSSSLKIEEIENTQKNIEVDVEDELIETENNSNSIAKENKNEIKKSNDSDVENKSKIQKLNELYIEGIINQEEYLRMKSTFVDSTDNNSKAHINTNHNINNVEKENLNVAKQYSDNELFSMGYKDGEKYFEKHQPASAGFVFGLIPFIGLVPTTICSVIPVSNNFNINNPNLNLYKNKEYKKGYKKGASKQKTKSVWAGFAAGTATLIALVIIL